MPKRRLSTRRAADLLKTKNVPIARAAAVLAHEPKSPVTEAIKLWGDDEEPFKHLMAAQTALARRWRTTMGRLIAHLERDRSGVTAYRGRNFESARARDAFLAPILERGIFKKRHSTNRRRKKSA